MIELIEIRKEHIDTDDYYKSDGWGKGFLGGTYIISGIKGLEKYTINGRMNYNLVFVNTNEDIINLNEEGYNFVRDKLYAMCDSLINNIIL